MQKGKRQSRKNKSKMSVREISSHTAKVSAAICMSVAHVRVRKEGKKNKPQKAP